MRYVPVILIAGMVTSVVTLAEDSAPRKATAPAPTCDTVFDSVAGGDPSDAANWTNGLPGQAWVGYLPDGADTHGISKGQQNAEVRGGHMSTRAEARGSPALPAGTGACCIGSTCVVSADEANCLSQDGFYLGDGSTCSGQCALGACCTGWGACQDDGGSGVAESTCTELPGSYLGGARCVGEPSPCPLCTVESGGSCQLDVFLMASLSDLAGPGGVTRQADDFVAQGTTINRVCVWGIYFDPKLKLSVDCSDAVVEDDFRVTVYADSGGIPGTEVGHSTVSVEKESQPYRNLAFGVPKLSTSAFQLTLDTPITGLVPGACYWLEVVNNTDTLGGELEPSPNSCYWHWARLWPGVAGNDYSYIAAEGSYARGGQRPHDGAFCLDANFDAGGCGDTPAACCTCPSEGAMCSQRTLAECEASDGTWYLTRADCGVACPTLPGLIDSCTFPDVVGDGTYVTDNNCATTDGLQPAPATFLVKDVWYSYYASCTGRLTISMCSTGNNLYYDAFMAVYHDDKKPKECIICPDNVIFQTLADENCSGLADFGAGIITKQIVFPGDCWTIRVGSWSPDSDAPGGVGLLTISCDACFVSSEPEPERISDLRSPSSRGGTPGPNPVVTKNRFLSIKAGDARGRQAIRVRFVDLPPPFDVWNVANLGTDFFVGEPFKACENSGQGRDVVAPDDCGPAGGLSRTWFWAAPLVCDEGAAHFMDWHGECDGGTCIGGLLEGDSCTTDEDCIDVVHLFHEGLVPDGVYDVQVVDSSCSLQSEGSYSAPLTMTQGVWGDICSDGPGGACTGVADGNPEVIQDVLGLIDKFQNINALQKSRADLVPGDDGTNNGPDFKVTIIGDALFALDAFQGFPYPFTPGDPCR